MNNAPRDADSYECRCSGCFGTITFRGEVAEIVKAERSGRTYCDDVCMRGSGVNFSWQPRIDSRTLYDMQQTVIARRGLVAKHRR